MPGASSRLKISCGYHASLELGSTSQGFSQSLSTLRVSALLSSRVLSCQGSAKMAAATYPSSSYPYSSVHTDVDIEKALGDGVELDGQAMLRAGFVRKVFGILSAQLLLTVAIATPIVAHPGVRSFVTTNAWFTGLAMVASFALLLVLSFSESARHSHPTNLILLAGFTAAEGVLVGAITSQYQMQAILLAVALTAVITVGLTLYAMQTKRDFTMQGGLLLTLLLTLVFTGLFAAFTRSPAMHLLMGGAGALLFGAYIVYDVQLLAGNAGKTALQLSPDEYVVGAIQVYLDVINLFLHLLRFISEMQRDS